MHVANMFKGKRHQNDVDDIVLVALLLAFNIFTYFSIFRIFDFDEQVVNIYWASTFQYFLKLVDNVNFFFFFFFFFMLVATSSSTWTTYWK